ncbi:hypothetical protein D3C76_1754740 [compost metagenome]
MQLRLQLFALFIVRGFGLLDARIALFLQLLCQLRHQLCQRIAQRGRALQGCWFEPLKLLEVPVNGGLGAGIT